MLQNSTFPELFFPQSNSTQFLNCPSSKIRKFLIFESQCITQTLRVINPFYFINRYLINTLQSRQFTVKSVNYLLTFLSLLQKLTIYEHATSNRPTLTSLENAYNPSDVENGMYQVWEDKATFSQSYDKQQSFSLPCHRRMSQAHCTWGMALTMPSWTRSPAITECWAKTPLAMSRYRPRRDCHANGRWASIERPRHQNAMI